MTRDEFLQKVGTYWSRTPIEVLDEIRNTVWSATDLARAELWRQMQRTVPAGRMVGVSDVYDAANATSTALTRHTAKEFNVRCDHCHATWSYLQGTRDQCPYCGLDYIATQDLKTYEAQGKVPDCVMRGEDPERLGGYERRLQRAADWSKRRERAG